MGRTKGSRNKPKVVYPTKVTLPPNFGKTYSVPGELTEDLRLRSGAHLDVGDVFWQIRKFVIKKITKYSGDNNVDVEAECTKKSWSNNNPLL